MEEPADIRRRRRVKLIWPGDENHLRQRVIRGRILAAAAWLFAVLGYWTFGLTGWLGILCGDKARNRLRDTGRRVSWFLALLALWVNILWAAISCVPMFCHVTTGAQRERARDVSCRQNLQRLLDACGKYADRHAGQLPPDFQALTTNEYFGDWYFVYTCPCTRTERAKSPAELKGPAHCDFRYFGGGQNLRTLDAQCVLVCDRTGNHAGHYNVGLAGGMVKRLGGLSWPEVVKAHNLRVPPLRPAPGPRP